MSGKYLLDTNIVVAFLKGESKVVSLILSAEEVSVCSITLGELMFGAYNSSKVEDNLKRVLAFKELVNVCPVDEQASQVYGQCKHVLKRNGTPIPENDVWIAAIAKQQGLTLVTRDKHFDKVEELLIEEW